jgi:hypothetical protein
MTVESQRWRIDEVLDVMVRPHRGRGHVSSICMPGYSNAARVVCLVPSYGPSPTTRSDRRAVRAVGGSSCTLPRSTPFPHNRVCAWERDFRGSGTTTDPVYSLRRRHDSVPQFLRDGIDDERGSGSAYDPYSMYVQ